MCGPELHRVRPVGEAARGVGGHHIVGQGLADDGDHCVPTVDRHGDLVRPDGGVHLDRHLHARGPGVHDGSLQARVRIGHLPY